MRQRFDLCNNACHRHLRESDIIAAYLSSQDKNLAMPAFLFLQKFVAGEPAAMPFDELTDLLVEVGPVRSEGESYAVQLPPDRYAGYCTIIGTSESGISCIGFEDPLYSDELRRLVWKCIHRFGCTAFSDCLERVYVGLDTQDRLPEAILEGSPLAVRRICSAQQLWPDSLSFPQSAPDRPALVYRRPGESEGRLQMFDHQGNGDRELYCHLTLHPAACTPGSIAVIIALMRRINDALAHSDEFALFYSFRHNETSLQVMEAAAPLPVFQNCRTVTFVKSGEQLFGDGQPIAPSFFADREIFASSLTQASDLTRDMEPRGLKLDARLPTLADVDRLLDEQHQLDTGRRQRSEAGEYLVNAEAIRWAVQAGCYLGVLVSRHIGGQWGYVTLGNERLPVVRTHCGTLCQPHLQVLDHIINGRGSSVAAWFERWAKSDVSATERADDVACNIPGFCQILLGKAHFSGEDGLPLESEIPRQHLDYSVGSLQYLDLYLDSVAAQIERLSYESLSNLELAAGAYLGEVIRSNTRDKSTWIWVNYADFARANPGFSDKRPWHRSMRVFLDSAENTTYPLAQISLRLTDPKVPGTLQMARQLLGDTAPASPIPTEVPTVPQAGARAEMLIPDAQMIESWPADPTMSAILEGVREKLGIWRRLATPTDYSTLRSIGPDWLLHHPLFPTVANQRMLLEKGDVVWGALLQANSLLFSAGPDDHPAAAIYSLDTHFESRPSALRCIAHYLFSFKEGAEQAPEDCRAIATWLADERAGEQIFPVSSRLSSRSVQATCHMVFRKHLPPRESMLSGFWFPLLVHDTTEAVIIAPSKFWPLDLINAWRNGELVSEPPAPR
ncbi:MAG: hypothetical protein Q8M11_13730 [Sulfuritalea sp.]|nr:hypothetical protein [Sulfuritalea sp.]